MKRLLLKSLVVSLALAALPLSHAADIKERSLKFATQNPKGHPIVIGMEKFAEVVAAKSGGKIKINLFPGGVLGGDAPTVSAMQGGTIDMASMNSGILASQVREFAIYDFPFLFANEKEADAVVDGQFGKMMHGRLTEKGLIGLGYFELGVRDMTGRRRALNTGEAIAGPEIRVIPNPINLDWVKALGANPTPLAFPEVYAALEQKAIDGQENPLTVIAANKFYEVQKHLALTHHVYNPQSVIISKKTWDTFSADEKKIFAEAALEATKANRAASRKQAAEVVDQLKKAGMQVTQFDASEMKKLRDKMKPVIDKYSEIVGPGTTKALMLELNALRGAR